MEGKIARFVIAMPPCNTEKYAHAIGIQLGHMAQGMSFTGDVIEGHNVPYFDAGMTIEMGGQEMDVSIAIIGGPAYDYLLAEKVKLEIAARWN